MQIKYAPLLSSVLALSFFAQSSLADSYTLTLPGGNVDWESAAWLPADGPENTGDDVTLSADAQTEFYIGADRAIGNLDFTSGTVRIRGGSISGSGDYQLSINHLSILNGNTSFTFVDKSAGSGGLSVIVNNLTINGNFFLGRTGVALSDFTISGTTTLNGGRLALHAATPNASLGKLVFHQTNATQVNLANGLGSYYGTPYTVKVASLNGGGASSRIITDTSGTSTEVQPTLRIEDATGGEATFYGRIESGTVPIKLEMAGTGTQVLARAGGHTYNGGTEISGGTLIITNTSGSGLGTGAVTLSGGTLGGAGIVALGDGNSITVSSGGTINPGAGDMGLATLQLSGQFNGSAPVLDIQSGGALGFALGSGNASDSIALSHYTAGDLLLDGAVVNVTDATAGLFVLFSFTDSAGNAVESGLTGGLQAGSGFDGYHVTFFYDNVSAGGIGSISMKLEAIPEPGSTALVAFALGAFGVFSFGKRLPFLSR